MVLYARNSSWLLAAGGATDVDVALIQFGATVCLTLFTFLLFRFKNTMLLRWHLLERRYELLSRQNPTAHIEAPVRPKLLNRHFLKGLCIVLVLICTYGFVVVMKDAYTPAVFTMALIAIVVAADHDMELEEASEQIRVTNEELKTSLENQVQRLAQLTESHTWAAKVLNWSEWKKNLVVVKHWEVPSDLIVGNRTFDLELKQSVTNGGVQNHEPVGKIKSLILDSDPCVRAFQHLYELDPAKTANVDPYLLFISPGPLRVRTLAENDSNSQALQSTNGLDTRYFFGLLYTMCCLYRVALADREQVLREEGDRRRVAKIRIGHAPQWLHILGDEVYQMVDTALPSRALSRPLHEELLKFGRDRQGYGTLVSGGDPSAGAPLTRWASALRNQQQGSFDRGSRAERYIASVILSVQGEKTNESDKGRFNFGLAEEKMGKVISNLLGGSDTGFATHALMDVLSGTGNEGAQIQGIEQLSGKLGDHLKLLMEEYIALRYCYVNFSGSSRNAFLGKNPFPWSDAIPFLIEEAVL